MESASSSARSHSASLACRAPARSRSRSAKCEPRRRLNVSRAAEYRFHSASSVLRSRPLIVRHSSRISRSRSPAAFHWVELAARSSASTASASLRAVCAARCSSRRARRPPRIRRRARRWPPAARPARRRRRAHGRRQALGERRRRGLDLAGVAGTGLQAPLHQRDLGGQVVEAAAEVRVGGLGVARLPRADDALAGGGDQPHRAVGVDPAEPVRIARRGRRDRRRRPAGARGGTRRSWPGRRVWARRTALLARWSSYPFLVPSAR